MKLRGIHFLMFLAFAFLTINAEVQPVKDNPEENKEAVAAADTSKFVAPADADVDADDEEDVLSEDAIADIEKEADAALFTVQDGTGSTYEDLQDFDYKQLTPEQYAKVKTKRKVTDLILRFLINTIFCFILTRFFYFPKSRRRDFFFTYMLVGFAIFMLIHLMSGEKMETGIGMGLFAIFCIMRYRTESVHIREMTYLFVIIALAALNGMAWDISMKREMFTQREMIAMSELILTNLLFVVIVWISESSKLAKGLSSKYINYDKIDLIVPEKYDELIEDLKKRTGLEITSVTIGNIDFLKDMAFIKIFYKDDGKTDEMQQKMPKPF